MHEGSIQDEFEKLIFGNTLFVVILQILWCDEQLEIRNILDLLFMKLSNDTVVYRLLFVCYSYYRRHTSKIEPCGRSLRQVSNTYVVIFVSFSALDFREVCLQKLVKQLIKLSNNCKVMITTKCIKKYQIGKTICVQILFWL